ncbi:complement C1s subcomponent-like isoform X2 [Mauremys mutica]|uniref:complement C1s subcomponent-like isoform X2 n=1 Tax=Mauremys mutica TaxID=74926 RepID=UPI001D149AAD|nr:complement C1s subcomponent-like isoform X2 [Mauremys mutica]
MEHLVFNLLLARKPWLEHLEGERERNIHTSDKTKNMLRLLLLWGSLLFGVVSSSPTPRKLFGEITSPNYPNPYPNNNISTWDITVPKGFVVELDFWQFDLQPSESCLSDYVKITADKKDLGQYCGQLGSATGNHPGVREFVSKGNQMRLMFHSDFSNEENGTLIPYKGFLAHYQAVGIQCPQPVPRDQFTLIKDLQPLYRFHDYVNVSCQTGYELMEGDQKLASFSAVCQDDGTWHRPMPRCEIVSCDDPKDLTNGAFSYVSEHGNNNYQSVITYRCEEPYYHIVTNSGSNTYNCSTQGSWADQDGHEDIPVCLPVIYRCSASGKWVSEEMGTELPSCVPVCGIPSTPIQELQRIFGGTRAKPGNFPWQVLFQNPRGGGVLISDRWVLTAAHMLDDSNSKPIMYAGVTNINQQIKREEPIQLFEEEVFIHPNWTKVANPEARTNFDNDIALLRLTAPVKMGPKISPLCLPGGSPEYELEKGRLGYISGWGRTEDRNKVYHLMKAQIPVVDMAQCRSVKPKPPADSTTFQFTDNMVCAGDGTKDSCSGDGGGAYAINDPHNDRQYYVGGLVSWGPRCGTYGLYTRVGRYRDWIMETMSRYEEAEESHQ